ncbi:hypothetical protein LINGRAHAP2_LOCUS24211 [Linum grandiflorum]
MTSSFDKRGGAPFSIRKHQRFIECCEDCGLSNLRFSRPRFTWYNRNKKHRLDRAISNTSWTLRFPQSKVLHLPRIKSDHRPLFITIYDDRPFSGPQPYRFIAGWLHHKDFRSFLESNWDVMAPLSHQLQHLTPRLRKWNKHVFSNVFKRKETLLKRLADIELANDQGDSPSSATM